MMLVLQLCVLLFLAASNPRVLLAQSLAAPYDPYRSHSATLDPKELQNLIVRNKTVFLMVADDGVQAQATLSIRSFHLVFPSNRVLVLGFSQSTMEWCEKLSGTLCRFMPHRLPICNYTEGSEIFSGPKRFGTEIFRLIQQCKQNAILQVLLLGFDLFFMDSDSLLLKDPWEVLPMNHSWEGACWGARGKQLKTKHRNVGMMWMRANPEIISVQQEFLDGLSKQPLMVNDEALYAQFADRGALDTYCLPHRIDGLGCNYVRWVENLVRGKLWGLHSACIHSHRKLLWLQQMLSQIPGQRIYQSPNPRTPVPRKILRHKVV